MKTHKGNSGTSKKKLGFLYGVLLAIFCLVTFHFASSYLPSQAVEGASITNIAPSPLLHPQQLSCSDCAHNGLHALCLNANAHNPVSYCSGDTNTNPQTGITCAVCPQITPSVTPLPSGCYLKEGRCPQFACRTDLSGKTICPVCPKIVVCNGGPTPTPHLSSTPTPSISCMPRQVCTSFFGFKTCRTITTCPQNQ